MADFKNIISGTFNNLVGKVKEVAETVEVKETVKGIYEQSSSAVKGIYEQGSSKVKAYGHIAKLSLELTSDKDQLKKLYTEIGRLYFEETQEPDAFFAPLFEEARAVAERIKDKEYFIEVLKTSEPDCCCGDDCCCDGDCDCDGECDCDCEGECCCAEEDIEVEVCEFEEVVEATEACQCEAPAEEAPVEEAPVEEAPVEEAPVEEAAEEEKVEE